MTIIPPSLKNGNVLLYILNYKDDPKEILDTIRHFGIKIMICLYTKDQTYIDYEEKEEEDESIRQRIKEIKDTIGEEAFVNFIPRPRFDKFEKTIVIMNKEIENLSTKKNSIYIDITRTPPIYTSSIELLTMKHENVYSLYHYGSEDVGFFL